MIGVRNPPGHPRAESEKSGRSATRETPFVQGRKEPRVIVLGLQAPDPSEVRPGGLA